MFKLIALCFTVTFLYSCSSTNKTTTIKKKKEINFSVLNRQCIKENIALSCAKLGYHFQSKKYDSESRKYYQLACSLGDEGSCYNLKTMNPRAMYFKKVDSLMKFYDDNIMNCYSSTSKNRVVQSKSQLKEEWYKVGMSIHIDKKGMADSIYINSELSNKFKACVKKEILKIKFPKPEGIDPTYRYSLTIRVSE